MDILVIGGGAREHSLVWKLKQSTRVGNIFVAPGNAGTMKIATNIPVSETEEIIEWLKENSIDLVVIGTDRHLAEGIVDKLEALNIKVFGPTQKAAEIEWSKFFAKQLMKEEGIPTANYEAFTILEKAKTYIKTQNFPLVIKASGLALGKGVVIANSLDEALHTLNEIMNNKIFGEAGDTVLIEEYLEGKEISIHAFSDGESAVLFPSAQDHKRIFDGDKGPNTGGMGVITPVPWVTDEHMKEIEEKIVVPILNALKRRGRTFKGLLFPGIMMTSGGPKVIEFNARFGDPETQAYMRILETDLVDILFACVNGTLGEQDIKWSKGFACCIVCASGGYPGEFQKGKVIEGLDVVNHEAVIFHAGTKLENNRIVTDGGRVISITSTADTLQEALSKSYFGIKSIFFEGIQFRKDIGGKSLL